MEPQKINVLKWEAIGLFVLAIAFSYLILIKEKTLFNDPNLISLKYTFLGLSGLFLLISIVLFILYLKRNSGVAKKIDTKLNETRENVFQKEYTVLGKPKHVVFLSILLFIIFIVQIAFTVFGQLNPDSPMSGFNIYNIITYLLFVVGLIFFWKVNKIGYIIFWVICAFNIILTLISLSFGDLIIWIAPILGLISLKKYFFPKTVENNPIKPSQ